jgi:hypothetical protein
VITTRSLFSGPAIALLRATTAAPARVQRWSAWRRDARPRREERLCFLVWAELGVSHGQAVRRRIEDVDAHRRDI